MALLGQLYLLELIARIVGRQKGPYLVSILPGEPMTPLDEAIAGALAGDLDDA